MKRILLVEPEDQLAGQLFQLLVRSGDFVVSAAPSQREAALIVAEQAQDLAVVPIDALAGAIAVLRSLQPDLRIVALLPPGVEAPPARYDGQLQGVLHRRGLEAALAEVLAEALSREVAAPAAPLPLAGSEAEMMAALLQRTALHEKVLAALLARGSELVDHGGTLEADQAAEAAARVAESWMHGHAAQVQFLRLQSRSSDLLLYTRAVGRDYLLTLAARPEAAVGEMRAQADQLAAALLAVVEGAGAGEAEPGEAEAEQNDAGEAAIGDAGGPDMALEGAMEEAAVAEEVETASYALVWRAERALGRPVEMTVRRVLQELAAAEGCSLTHLQIDGKLVHLVVQCPPETSSTALVRLLKDGSEAEIKAQSGLTARLWEKGYYAVPSHEPLDGVELSLFAQQSP
jgi:hypothetical protein